MEEDWGSGISHSPQHTERHLQSDTFLCGIILQSIAVIYHYSKDVYYILCEEGEKRFALKSAVTLWKLAYAENNILCNLSLLFQKILLSNQRINHMILLIYMFRSFCVLDGMIASLEQSLCFCYDPLIPSVLNFHNSLMLVIVVILFSPPPPPLSLSSSSSSYLNT